MLEQIVVAGNPDPLAAIYEPEEVEVSLNAFNHPAETLTSNASIKDMSVLKDADALLANSANDGERDSPPVPTMAPTTGDQLSSEASPIGSDNGGNGNNGENGEGGQPTSHPKIELLTHDQPHFAAPQTMRSCVIGHRCALRCSCDRGCWLQAASWSKWSSFIY